MEILLVGADLMFAGKASAMAAAAGGALRMQPARGPFSPAPGQTAFVALYAAGALDAVRALAQGGAEVIAFGSHVDEAAFAAARDAGARETIPNSRFEARLRQALGA